MNQTQVFTGPCPHCGRMAKVRYATVVSFVDGREQRDHKVLSHVHFTHRDEIACKGSTVAERKAAMAMQSPVREAGYRADVNRGPKHAKPVHVVRERKVDTAMWAGLLEAESTPEPVEIVKGKSRRVRKPVVYDSIWPILQVPGEHGRPSGELCMTADWRVVYRTHNVADMRRVRRVVQ